MTIPRRRSLAIALGIVAGVSLTLYYIELTTIKRDHFVRGGGALNNVIAHDLEVTDDGHVLQDLRLTSTTGLVLDVRVLRPIHDTDRPLPTLLIVGGQRTGKNAVDALERMDDVAFVAIDYPYVGPRRIRGVWQTLRALPDIQRATIDTPPALRLVVDWLVEQSWVDAQRIELVGISVGVPFAAAASALDSRISRVWLIHGPGDNVAWAEFAMRKSIQNRFARGMAAKLLMLYIHGKSFDTLQWIPEIAPRPIIVISARDDDRVPAGSALATMAPAELVETIWTDGRHIGRSRRDELQALFTIFRERLAL